MPDVATERNRWPWLATFMVVAAMVAATGARAQPLDLDAWVEVETPHVTLLTNADVRRGAEVAATLERFRGAFALLAPGFDLEAPAPTRMIAFRDGASFAPYRQGAGRGVTVLGQFISSPDGNVLTLDADPRHVAALAVIYHEYVHYLVGSNLPDVPRWFNEGLAEYYSSFVIEEESVRIGRAIPRHLRWLSEHGVPSLTELLGASGSHRHGAGEVGAFYAGSWLLVHYLLSGDGERLDRTAALLAELASGAEAEDAIEDIFDIRTSELERRLEAYLAAGRFAEAVLATGSLPRFEVSVRSAAAADVLTVLGDLSARLGDPSAGATHFHQALAHDPQHAAAHGGLAWVRDLEARFDEAELLFGDALALGTDDPVVYLRWGRHLLHTLDAGVGPAGRDEEPETAVERAERARQAFRRVTELAPDFAEGWAMLGIAHLVGEVDPAAGIPSLVRAVDRLPARLDLVVRLVELEARAGRFERAEARIDRSLAGRAEEAVVARAREEVGRRRLIAGARQAFDAGEIDEGLRLFDRAVAVTSDAAMREALEQRLVTLQRAYGR